jgi:predicted nuclease with TOPRIM domain
VGRQKCCSNRCRAALSRQRRIPIERKDLRDLQELAREMKERASEIRADATVMLEGLEKLRAELDEYLGGQERPDD